MENDANVQVAISSRPFMVGEVVPGYCGGTFSIDTMGDDLRVEAVGIDWLVLRSESGAAHFYQGSHSELRIYADYEMRDRREQEESDRR